MKKNYSFLAASLSDNSNLDRKPKRVKIQLLALLLMISFTINAQPVITALSTLTGILGSTVVISGSGFNTTAANNIVFFGATKAAVTAASGTSLTATVPAGATYAHVSVNNTATALTGCSPKSFMPTFVQSVYTPQIFLGTRTTLYAGISEDDIAIGDLDGDGKPDIATANDDYGQITLYRNTSTTGSLGASSFASGVNIYIGENSLNIIIADIDGDGKSDIIVSDDYYNVVTVLRNTATSGSLTTSSFASGVNFTTGAVYKNGLRVADIDHDGKPDIIAGGNTGFMVLRNTSVSGTITSGSFASPVSYATFYSTPGSLEVGDIDGDGKADVAVLNSGMVSVFRNTATAGSITSGSFSTSVSFNTTAGFSAKTDLLIADIDGDSKPEIVTTNYNDNTISVFRNTASSGSITTGSFAAKVDFATGVNPLSIAVGDIDGDGKPDIITTNDGTDSATGPQAITILKNTSTSGAITTGSFATRAYYVIYQFQNSLAIGDLDGDGRPDIALVSGEGGGLDGMTIVRNCLPPPVINSISASSGIPGSSLTITGNNFNTTPDSNFVHFGATRAAVTAASHTSLSVTLPPGASFGELTVTNKALGLTGYSNTDFLPRYDNSSYLPGSINFDPRVDFTSGANAYSVAYGDIDGDGKPDMVVGSDNSFTIFRNISTAGSISSGSFAAGVTFTGYPASKVIISDIDGDGKKDLVVGTISFYIFRNIATSGTISTSSFATPVYFANGPLFDIADANNDGKPDILTTSYDGYTGICQNTSITGTINSNSIAAADNFGDYLTFYYPGKGIFKDLDGDKKPDILVTDYNRIGIGHNTSRGGSLLGNPDGSPDPEFNEEGFLYANSYNSLPYTNVNHISVGDIDGDGKPDIVAPNGHGFSIFRNLTTTGVLGSASFAAQVDFNIGFEPADLDINDFDGDGKLDVVVLNNAGANLTVYRNTATSGSITTSSLTAIGTTFATLSGPLNIKSGDLDNDGKPDLAVVYQTNATVSIFRNSPIPTLSITGTTNICVGTTTTLSIAATGGTWSSSTSGIATIGSATGVLSGIASGTATISYSFSTGGNTTTVVTVSAVPSAGTITGTFTLCPTTATTLSDAAGSGVWSSSNTGIATAGSSSGTITGVSAGTTIISYTVTNSGCTANATQIITVNPSPDAGTITGTTTVCTGSSTALSNSATGGTWSSTATGIATINSTGNVSAVAAGTSTISYTVTNSCGTLAATSIVTVNPIPDAGTISGTSSLCVASGTTFTNTATGGTWSSGTTTIATAGSTGIVTGVATGTATISYTVANSCGTAYATAIITINPLPDAGTITGTYTVCPATTTALSDAASGGAWSSSITGTASVGSTGIVTGVTAGITVISYTVSNGCGTAFVTHNVTVNPLPLAGSISGASTVCNLSTVTLTDPASGGVWTSGSTAVATVGATGVVTGVSAGTATISYVVVNSCGSAVATAIVTVNPLPVAGAITGSSTLCPGASAPLTDLTSGGVWSSSASGIATISTTGTLTAVAAGNTTISYAVTNSCGTDIATHPVTVNPLPDAGIITGTPTACAGTSATLSDIATGGIWTSSMAVVASVSGTGVVSAIIAGTAIISYSVTNSCGTAVATQIFTVNPLPDAGSIVGTPAACASAAATLSDISSGGTWSSSTPAIATVGSSGIVSGLTAGTTKITYSVTNSCGTAITTVTFTVNPLPVAGSISGTSHVCVGTTVPLTDATPGGSWSSSSGVATISSAGIVAGITAGNAVITYTVTNSCGTDMATYSITVNPLPNAGSITGTDSVCIADSVSLIESVTGGAWSSSSPATALITPSGIVIGLSEGIDTIKYTVTNSCVSVYTAFPIHVRSFAACFTGVNNLAISDADHLIIYPNPAKNLFNVRSAANGTIDLYSLDGRRQARYNVTAGTNSFDLPKELAAGIYSARFTGIDGAVQVTKLTIAP